MIGERPILIKFIRQHGQRIALQLDDYQDTENCLAIRITRFKNPAYTMAVLIHALWEKFRNDLDGVQDKQVDDWDLAHPELPDPGLDPRAPYHRGHMEADTLERLAIILAGEDWPAYEQAIEEVSIGEESGPRNPAVQADH